MFTMAGNAGFTFYVPGRVVAFILRNSGFQHVVALQAFFFGNLCTKVVTIRASRNALEVRVGFGQGARGYLSDPGSAQKTYSHQDQKTGQAVQIEYVLLTSHAVLCDFIV